jgi:hypothetical protein
MPINIIFGLFEVCANGHFITIIINLLLIYLSTESYFISSFSGYNELNSFYKICDVKLMEVYGVLKLLFALLNSLLAKST